MVPTGRVRNTIHTDSLRSAFSIAILLVNHSKPKKSNPMSFNCRPVQRPYGHILTLFRIFKYMAIAWLFQF